MRLPPLLRPRPGHGGVHQLQVPGPGLLPARLHGQGGRGRHQDLSGGRDLDPGQNTLMLGSKMSDVVRFQANLDCIPVRCNLPENPLNGKALFSSTDFGAVVNYEEHFQ